MSVSEKFQQLEAHADSLIIGQSRLINRMLIALLCDGHLLVAGAPGLATRHSSTGARPVGKCHRTWVVCLAACLACDVCVG